MLTNTSHSLDDTVNQSLRRFIKTRECSYKSNVWTVHTDLFHEPDESELSFHKRPEDWNDNHFDIYRRAYAGAYTIPGVVQISATTFQKASLSIPVLRVDENDEPLYQSLHCSWPNPVQEDAKALADIVTTAIALEPSNARVVHNRIKL